MASPNDPKQDTAYNTRTLSKWFALSTIGLLVVMVWAVLQDYGRPWKTYSRQSQKLVAAVGEAQLARAQKAMDQSKLAGVEKSLAELKGAQGELVEEVNRQVSKAEAVYYKANQEYQFSKANLDAALFELERSYHHLDPAARKLKKDYLVLEKKVAKLKAHADDTERARDAALANRADLLSQQKAKEDELRVLTAERERLRKLIEKNEANLANLLRNAPLVDFIAPTVKINQVVLPRLKDDYFFNKVPRVDRCMTCHATIDKVGFEDFPQPFKTHPKLDLMVGSNSKHPMEKVGCTVCHAGVPQSADFALAAHTPKDESQELEWHHRYGYHRSEHIGTPMLKRGMIEGKCLQCHAQQTQLAGAQDFNAGMRIIERMGCYGCHRFGGPFDKLKEEKKAGPSLERVASKLDVEWIKKWLWEPTSFRPSTTMPRYWQNHNNSDKASLARGAVEIDAIAHFIVSKSTPYEPLKLASNSGDIEKGKKIVGSVGCLGCHASADFPRKNPEDPTAFGYRDPRIPNFGPELNQMGSKVSREWLVSWLSNPKHYWEGTSMPSLKLSPDEVSDIAAYLLSKRNEAFEKATAPVADDKVRDQVVMSFLEKTLPPADAKAKLASLSLDDKRKFLGEKLIGAYGCYGCHAIQGFEKAPNIGAELAYEGSKDTSKFDYGNVEIFQKSRADWVYTKVRTPRIWDVGKNRDFEGKARMPQFNLTHEQATAVAAIVLGHENKNVDDEAIQKVDGRLEQIIAGQRLVRRKNCLGCHVIEKTAGEILAYYPDDITLGPPNLNTQGKKTQTDWLYAYLTNPDVRIRPWLDIRMPQFHLSSAEATTMTKYFAALDNAPYPFVESHAQQLSAADRDAAEKLVKQLDCLSCHRPRNPGEEVATAAPHFKNIKARLKGPWVLEWIHDPAAIMPGTRMPTLWPPLDDADPKAGRAATPGYFGDDPEKQMQAIRNYLFTYPGEPTLPSPRADLNSPLAKVGNVGAAAHEESAVAASEPAPAAGAPAAAPAKPAAKKTVKAKKRATVGAR